MKNVGDRLREWSIKYYDLAEDEKHNTARWRAMEQSVENLITFLWAVVATETKEITSMTDYSDPNILRLLGLKG
jgi:hypothetical protein